MPIVALFLSEPRALALLALAVPLIAAHLWRRRRRAVVVPSVALLVEARAAVGGGGVGRRLEERLALASRLLALVALTLLVAGIAPRAPRPPVPLVLVVDLDWSVTAREADGRPRLANALDLAAAETRAHDEGPVGVVLAGATPGVFAQPESDREGLARRLSAPELPGTLLTNEPADLGAALAVARRLAGDGGRVAALTARALPPDEEASGVRALGTGASDDDQGIVDLVVGPLPDGTGVRLVVTTRGFGPKRVERGLSVRVEGGVEQRRTVVLEPGAEASATFDLQVPRGGAPAHVRLGGIDAYARNDAAVVVLEGPLKPTVLAVHGGQGLKPWTAAALEALGERIDRTASGGVAAADLARAGARDVTLVDGAALPPGALTPGAWLFLAPLSGELPFAVGKTVERPLVWRARVGHPLVLDLDLADAWVSRATPLVPGPGVVDLASAGADEPVLAEGERDGVRWVALGLEPEGSDLPVRAAFPLLVRNAVLRLARGRAHALPPFVRAGTPLTARVPLPGGPDAEIAWTGPAPVRARLAPETGPRAPRHGLGLVTVRTGTGAAAWEGRTAVVDLERERTIVPVSAPALRPAPRATPPDPARALRLALALLAAALLALDLFLLSARVRRAAPSGGAAGALPHALALSGGDGSIAPWKTESSPRP